MRILRRQSNLEVSSQGLAFFVIGMVTATFLGGAVRTLLHSEQVQKRIVRELKERFPKQDIEIGHAEVLLSRGIWPGLALQLRNVTLKQDVCGKLSFALTLPHSVWPVRIFSLLKQPIRLADVEIEGGGLHLDYRDCKPGEKAETTPLAMDPSAAPAERAPSPAAWKNPSLAIPKLEWGKAARVLHGVDLQDFGITYEKNPTWKVWIKSAYLSLNREVEMRAAVEVQKSLPFGALSHPMELEIHGEEQNLDLNINAEFKEGRVQVAGKVDLQGQTGAVSIHLRQVPIKDFMSEMAQMGLAAHDLKLKSTWLSCGLRWDGSLVKPTLKPVQVSSCHMEGGYGRAELEKAEAWLDGGDYFREPARIRVMQLQIQPMLEAFHRQLLPAVLSQLGQWSGDILYGSQRNWSINGNLENAEIVFANQSSRGKQVVNNIQTLVKRRGGATTIKLDQMQLKDGELAGSIEGELDDQLKNGTFQLQLPRLSLAPPIQKLLVGGSIDAIRAEGSGTLVNGELEHWNGMFLVSEVKGEGWSARDVLVRSRFQLGTFKVNGKVRTASIDGNWRFYPELKRVLVEVPPQVTWNDLAVVVEIQKTGGTVQNFTARQANGPEWRTVGTWVRDGLFRGNLTLGGGGKGRSHPLRGENGRLAVLDP